MKRAVRTALRVALSSYVLIGLSAASGFFVISIVVQLAFGPFASAIAAIGVIVAIPPDQPAPRRGKLRHLLPSVVVALPLFYAVQVLNDDPWRLGLLIVPAAFVAFLGAAWGKRGIPVSMSAMFAIVFSIAVSDRMEEASPLATTTWLGLGMVSYVVWATLANLALNARYRVLLLAETLLSVAALTRTTADRIAAIDGASSGPIGPLIRDQAALADQLQGARDLLLESPRTPLRQRLAVMLMRTLELRDHLLACELDVDMLLGHPGQAAVLRAVRNTMHDLAGELEHFADALLTGRTPVPFASHRPHLAGLSFVVHDAALDTPSRPSPTLLARALADRVGHIDDEVLRLIALARGETRPDLAIVRTAWQLFVSPTAWSIKPFLTLWRWDAPPLRHALRAALAIATGYGLALALPWGTHPYWILLTITVVLRGSLAQTLERRNSRVVGTLLGSLLAAALLKADATPLVLLLTVTLAQGVAHAFAIRRYLVTSVAATVLALTQAHLLNAEISPTFEAFERIADTLLGVAIAWAFSYVLPSWERTQIPVLVERTLQAHARHARLSLGLAQLEASDTKPELDWRLARREVYDSLSALVQAAQRSLSEPRAVRPPLESLGPLLAHSYQLLAQLTAAKTMLLLRRGRLDLLQIAGPLQGTAERIATTLSGNAAPSAGDAEPPIGLTFEPLALDDPFERDLSPWLLRRLQLAGDLATEVRLDAQRVLQASPA